MKIISNKYIKAITQIFKHLWLEGKINCLLPAILTILGSITRITIPYLFKEVIESISSNKSLVLVYAIVSYISIWIINNTLPLIKDIYVSKIQEKISSILTNKLLARVLNLPFEQYANYKTGEITNLFTKAKSSIPPLFWGVFFNTIPLIIEIIIVTIVLIIKYSYFYSLLLIMSFISVIFFSFNSTKFALKIRSKANKKDKYVDSKITDWIINYKAIKIFNMKDHIINKCKILFEDRAKSEIKAHYAYSMLLIGQSIILGITFSTVTSVLGYFVYIKKLTLGDFILMHSYLLIFIGPINSLGFVFNHIKKAIVDIDELLNFVYTNQQEEKAKIFVNEKKIDNNLPLEIEFVNVTFKYQNNIILNNVSFKIEARQITGLIGESGIGKSTIIMLILGIHKVNQGEILINKQNISSIPYKELNQHFNVLPQNTFIFNDTFSENIRISNHKATLKEIKKSSELSFLNEVVNKLPKKYESLIAERGMKLSGGEKQRIAIARFFLNQAKNCLLDECTTSLDPLIKDKIESNIEKFINNKTTLIVAHNYSLLRKADKILKLEKGKIVDIGKNLDRL